MLQARERIMPRILRAGVLLAAVNCCRLTLIDPETASSKSPSSLRDNDVSHIQRFGIYILSELSRIRPSNFYLWLGLSRHRTWLFLIDRSIAEAIDDVLEWRERLRVASLPRNYTGDTTGPLAIYGLRSVGSLVEATQYTGHGKTATETLIAPLSCH